VSHSGEALVALDLDLGPELHHIALLLVEGARQRVEAAAYPGVDGHRGDQPQPVEAVVQVVAVVLRIVRERGLGGVVEQMREEGHRQEAERDGVAERAFFHRPDRIDVHRVRVERGLAEKVDQALVNRQPVGDADVFAGDQFIY
jgi:hypothetical protein